MTDKEKANMHLEIVRLNKENIELKKEIEELKKDKEWLDNTNNEQTIVILSLQAQIEKMKDYGNCKYGYYGNMCTRDDTNFCEGCIKWELAE